LPNESWLHKKCTYHKYANTNLTSLHPNKNGFLHLFLKIIITFCKETKEAIAVLPCLSCRFKASWQTLIVLPLLLSEEKTNINF
jgi:hypothetical protein